MLACQNAVIQENQTCQNALKRETQKNIKYNQPPPEPDINRFGIHEVAIGFPVRATVKIIEGGRYLLQFGGKALTFTKEAYAKIYNKLQSGKNATVVNTSGNTIQISERKGQIVVYENFTNSAGRTTSLIPVKSTPVSSGDIGTISTQDFKANGLKKRTKEIRMVVKTSYNRSPIFNKNGEVVTMAHSFEMHNILKKLGIPVFNMLRISTDEKKLLSSNLNTKGVFALSTINPPPKTFITATTNTKGKIFFDEKSVKNTLETIKDTINIAIRNNIELPSDSIFLLPNIQTGKTSFIVGDLDMVRRIPTIESSYRLGVQDAALIKENMININLNLYDAAFYIIKKYQSSKSPNFHEYIKKMKKAHRFEIQNMQNL